MKEKIEGFIRESGLWSGYRHTTHRFRLTPDIFPIKRDSIKWLQVLGPAITECLSGLGRIAAVASNHDLAKNRTWHMIRHLTELEVSPLFRELQLLRPSTPPLVFRVDVVEADTGELFVVEIEATKSHGLGYASLFSRIAKAIGHQPALPGIISLLAQETRRQNPVESKLLAIYAESEAFYLPELEVLQRELRHEGVDLVIASEHELSVEAESLVVRGHSLGLPLLLGLPMFTGSRSRKPNKAAEQGLAAFYQKGQLNCLIPPKPYLGSKAMMAILRNDAKNEDLEAILRSQISAAALKTVRAALPETFLIERNFEIPPTNLTRYVLKEVVSSGAHGITFSEDQRFEAVFETARRTTGHFVLQRVIETRQRAFHYYPESNGTAALSAEWYLRLGVFYIARELAEVCVTGCQKPPVHGGKESIFMSSTLA